MLTCEVITPLKKQSFSILLINKFKETLRSTTMINRFFFLAVYNLLFIANRLPMCMRLYSEQVTEGKKKRASNALT